MAKKRAEVPDTEAEETIEEVAPQSKKKDVEISVGKFLQQSPVRLTRYEAAYVTERFRGIMKSTASWEEEIRKTMEEGLR